MASPENLEKEVGEGSEVMVGRKRRKVGLGPLGGHLAGPSSGVVKPCLATRKSPVACRSWTHFSAFLSLLLLLLLRRLWLFLLHAHPHLPLLTSPCLSPLPLSIPPFSQSSFAFGLQIPAVLFHPFLSSQEVAFKICRSSQMVSSFGPKILLTNLPCWAVL